jgi:hypothetical protein
MRLTFSRRGEEAGASNGAIDSIATANQVPIKFQFSSSQVPTRRNSPEFSRLFTTVFLYGRRSVGDK